MEELVKMQILTQWVWGGGDWECLPSSSGDLTQVMEIKAQPQG